MPVAIVRESGEPFHAQGFAIIYDPRSPIIDWRNVSLFQIILFPNCSHSTINNHRVQVDENVGETCIIDELPVRCVGHICDRQKDAKKETVSELHCATTVLRHVWNLDTLARLPLTF